MLRFDLSIDLIVSFCKFVYHMRKLTIQKLFIVSFVAPTIIFLLFYFFSFNLNRWQFSSPT